MTGDQGRVCELCDLGERTDDVACEATMRDVARDAGATLVRLGFLIGSGWALVLVGRASSFSLSESIWMVEGSGSLVPVTRVESGKGAGRADVGGLLDVFRGSGGKALEISAIILTVEVAMFCVGGFGLIEVVDSEYLRSSSPMVTLRRLGEMRTMRRSIRARRSAACKAY